MRRVAVVLALLCSGTAISAAPNVVHAAEPAAAVENIYRTQVIQTTGPASSALPWGLDRIDQRDLPLSGSYSYTATGAGVKAYIVDSGIKADHVEFAGRVASGWSYRAAISPIFYYWSGLFDSCKTPSAGSPLYDASEHPIDVDEFDYTRDANDVGSPDNNGHGTHVAAIIGGATTGVAKGVTLVPVRIGNSCGYGNMDLIFSAALDWILADHQPGERAVVNMSIKFMRRNDEIDRKIESLLAEGIVVVAAAGNEGSEACGITPAGIPGVISVGASTKFDDEVSFSNYGTCVDMYAPGVENTSAWHYDGGIENPYATLSGTSMAAPHVAGAVARYLQTATVTNTTPTDVWNWLKTNATCNAIKYYAPVGAERSRIGSAMTPNRLLAIDAPASVPCAPNNVRATVGNRSSIVTWDQVDAGNGSEITGYIATAMPGEKSCSVVSETTCTISGLVNNTTYSISVAATNGVGVGATSAAVAVVPDGKPEAPATATSLSRNKSISLSWGAVVSTANVTYVVTSGDGNVVCRTAQTSCVVDGLLNGVKYDFAISTASSTGQVAETSLSLSARPGFTIKKSDVAKKSSTLLSRILTSVSTGKKSWKESGSCSIVRGKLVAPNKKTTCRLSLSVAKTKKYPAMSTRVTIWVK